MLTAPTVHCSLPSCTSPCSVQLLGSAVVEYDFVLEPDVVYVVCCLAAARFLIINYLSKTARYISVRGD